VLPPQIPPRGYEEEDSEAYRLSDAYRLSQARFLLIVPLACLLALEFEYQR